MVINRGDLEKLILQVARDSFDRRKFRRRQLMDAAEKEARSRGYWKLDDDKLSGSAGLKSRGWAAIDWRITDLGRRGGLVHVARDWWWLP